MKVDPPRGEHAIVIGASIGGLLAARVLADFFRNVTVIEKDACPVEIAARKSVSQGHHTHVLLPAGAQVLDRLFPGRLADLIRDGSRPFDYGGCRFHLIGNWMPRVETGLFSLAQTRPFLEEHLRRWVSEIPNIRLSYDVAVARLLFDGSGLRVAGVSLKRAINDRAGRDLQAELVIDATGRRTRLPVWLAEHGYGAVPETNVGINLAYTTGRFRTPDDFVPDHPILYIVGHPPQETRIGAVVCVENGLISGSVGGYHGDHPPTDLPGFLEFARSLCQPHVFDVLSRSELVAPLARYKFSGSIRRHYGKLARFPDGILPIADAVCSFDPAFGQGMTVAALEAEILADCLARGADTSESYGSLRRKYLKRIESLINIPWDLSCGENLKYPQTTGTRSLTFHLARRYRDRIATCGDAYVTSNFYRVLTLTASPGMLLRPRIVVRALRRRPYGVLAAIK